MYRVEGRRANQFKCFVESQTLLYEIAQTFQVTKSGVTLITVVDILLNTQSFQRQHTTDTQQNLLLQTVFPVTTIQL